MPASETDRPALPDADMPGVAALIVTYYEGGDIEAALDAVDTREAARGLAWLFSRQITLTTLTPAEFLSGLKTAIITEHLRRAVTRLEL
jgi:hypothetical protein